MNRLILVLLSMTILTTYSFAKELKLVDYYFIDSKEPVEPSGLCIKNGTLYFISDDNDETIYSLSFEGKKCTATPEIKFQIQKGDKKKGDKKQKKRYNFEGISTDANGNFYIVGEKSFSVIVVNKNGEMFATKSFKGKMEDEGMFRNKLEGPEGICIEESGGVIISSQNDHGKLMTAAMVNNELDNFNSVKIKSKEIKSGHGKEKSISDMNYFNGNIYILLKNQNTILMLSKDDKNFKEEEAYTFEDSVKGSEFLYIIGNNLGEGIAVDDKYIYVVYDNNMQPRLASINDIRPLLLKFEKPKI